MLAALALAALAQEPTAPPYAELARAWLTAHGVEAAAVDSPEAIVFRALLERAFLGAEIGALELRYPAAFLSEPERAGELVEVLTALVALHVRFLDWCGAGNEAELALREDFVALQAQLAGARPSGTGTAVRAEDLWGALGLGDPAREIAARAGARFRSAVALGLKPTGQPPLPIVCGPTRTEFVGLVCALGWIDVRNRDSFWKPDIETWNDVFWNDLQGIALSYPPFRAEPGEAEAGLPMNRREATGLRQFAMQRGLHSLSWYLFQRELDPVFESMLALEIVIEVYRENNARTGASTRGNETLPFEVFVPGGMSQGGTLPAHNPDNRFRVDKGADYFVKILREAQREGAREKGAKKNATFQILADDKIEKRGVTAPFLGSAAAGRETPPPQFLSDYTEFFRAYKACFLYWLRREGGGRSAKDSERRFAELLRSFAARPAGQTFEKTLEKVYGTPWSAQDLAEDSLEARFVAWLARQK